MEGERVAEKVGHDEMRLGVARVVEHDEEVLLGVLAPVGGEAVLVQRYDVVR